MASSPNPSETRVVLLTDHPASEDEFSGGGHARTACALSDLLKEKQMSGKAIGLEGGWGSGKSTVIQLAKTRLNTDQDKAGEHIFFTFSLWRSHTRNLKREFLAELLELFHSRGLIHEKKYAEIRDGVRGRSRTVRTQNRANLTLAGIVSLALLPLVPVVTNWLDVFRFGVGGGNVGTVAGAIPVNWFNTVLLTSYLLGYLLLLYKLGKNWLGGKRVTEGLDFLESRSREDTTTEYIVERDAAQFEFREIFGEILSISKIDRTKLVIVLDDIDRVDAEAAYAVWSVAREIATTAADIVGEQSGSLPTTVIPFDREHLQECAAGWRNAPDGAAGQPLASIAAESLVEKTFATVLKVAPPILSDWKAYFDQQFERLFSAHNLAQEDGACYQCYRMYEWVVDGRGDTTPRSIKSFLNDIASLHMQWANEISLSTISGYIAARRVLGQEKLVLPRMDSRFASLTSRLPDANWQEHFAALDYNVEPGLAVQVVVADALRDALRQNQTHEVKRYSHYAGFSEQVVRQLDKTIERLAENAPDDLGKIGALVSELTLRPEEAKAVWRRLGLALSNVQSLSLSARLVQSSLHTTFRYIPDNQCIPALKQLVRASITGFRSREPSSLDIHDGSEWAETISELEAIVSDRLPGKAFDIVLPTDAKLLPDVVQIGIIIELSKAKSSRMRKIARALDVGTVVNGVATLLPGGENDWRLTKVLNLQRDQLTAQHIKSLAGDLEPSLVTRPNDTNTPSAAEALSALAFGSVLTNSNDHPIGAAATKSLNTIQNGGSLLYWLDRASDEAADEQLSRENRQSAELLLASCLMSMLLVGVVSPGDLNFQHPELGDLSAIKSKLDWLNTDGVPGVVAGQIAQQLADVSKVGAALDEITKNPNVMWLRQTIIAVGQSEAAGNSLTTASVATALPALVKELSSKELNSLLWTLRGWTQHVARDVKQRPNTITVDVLDALLGLPKNSLAKAITEGIEERVRALDDSVLEELVAGKHPILFDQIEAIAKIKQFSYPSKRLRVAIASTAEDWLTGGAVSERTKNSWPTLIKLVQKNYISPLYNEILSRVTVKSTSSDGVEEFLEKNQSLLTKCDAAPHMRTLVEKIFQHLAEQETERSNLLLSRDFDFWVAALSATSESVRAFAIQLLKDNAELPEIPTGVRRKMAIKLGVELPRSPESE